MASRPTPASSVVEELPENVVNGFPENSSSRCIARVGATLGYRSSNTPTGRDGVGGDIVQTVSDS
jgi:hypothetical protein